MENNSTNRELTIHFSENAEEEIRWFLGELNMWKLIQSVNTSQEITDDMRKQLNAMFFVLSDLFSTDVPQIDADPEITLRMISRDIQLGRILRERGIFRMHRLLNFKVYVNDQGEVVDVSEAQDEDVLVPIFRTMQHPENQRPFRSQEEFIGWFCQEAHVMRSTLFMRLAAIEKLQTLGFTEENTFRVILSKPSVIQDTLNIGEWDKDRNLIGINPDIATRIAERSLPAEAEEIRELAEAAKDDDPAAQRELLERIKPGLVNLVEEVVSHDSAADAARFIKYDILQKPEIRYEIDPESFALVVVYYKKAIDERGQEFVVSERTIQFIPDTVDEVPHELVVDLASRLPIRNRQDIGI